MNETQRDAIARLPGDIRIDLAIHKLGFGSPCLPKQIDAKLEKLQKQEAEKK